ncbi:MAG: acyl-CoA dehydrogenase family protein, partial [Acidimicrobiales bacterium]|nr:acyl-CoA dehydrogenase family protein [Acidimicrobiales bacterium]
MTTYDVNAPVPEWARTAPRSCDDPVARARALRPIIERGAAESERIGRLCDDTARALCDSGLFGLLVPREFGGIEADPTTCIDVIEELAYADGSAGWVMIATTFCIAGACSWLGPTAIDAMYHGDGGYIAAAQIAPNGVAERVDDGWRIRGQFHFGSGSQLSSWFMGAFVEHEHGVPALDADGMPQVLFIYAPREQVYLDPASWDVTGLRATASHDFRFVDQVVHDDFVMFPPRRERRGGPILDVGVSLGHVAWSMGAANRILDELAALASRKQRQGRTTLIDQPTFQRDFGMMRATLDAARCHVRSVFEDWYAAAAEHGTAPLDVRARARLAACWGTKVAADVGQQAYL